MGRIIAISNQKGGVGKTTTATNLATALAACGKRILVIDLDPQGNTTTALNITKANLEHSIYSVLMEGSTLAEATFPTSVPGLFVVPTTVHLSGAEVELVPMMAREFRLKKALEEAESVYDYIFIDCPPSLGLLTLNALAAAQHVLVPVQCEFFAMEGISQLFQTISLVRRSLNPSLEVMGVLLTMFDVRNRLSSSVEGEIRAQLGEKVFTTVIPRNVRVSEAPSYGKPVLLYDVNCAGSQAYMRLAAEIVRRAGSKNMDERVAA